MIDKKKNAVLQDMANRQGLDENIYYQLFVEIILVGIKEFERYRQNIVRKINAKNQVEGQKATKTEETDTNGGKRVSDQQNDTTKVVMSSESGGNSPVILKTYKPKVIGVVIAAEGAESSKVRYDIEKAVSSLYGISVEKVNVYPMGI